MRIFLLMFFFAQVGLIMSGIEIENMVVGGPAFTSMCLEPGDVLLAVDGSFATENTVENMLVGSDKPGTLVTLTVAKGGSEVFPSKPLVHLGELLHPLHGNHPSLSTHSMKITQCSSICRKI
jgi:hypothetical protein